MLDAELVLDAKIKQFLAVRIAGTQTVRSKDFFYLIAIVRSSAPYPTIEISKYDGDFICWVFVICFLKLREKLILFRIATLGGWSIDRYQIPRTFISSLF